MDQPNEIWIWTYFFRLIQKDGYFSVQKVADNREGFPEMKQLKRSERRKLLFFLEK
jgi:hypothetical protein